MTVPAGLAGQGEQRLSAGIARRYGQDETEAGSVAGRRGSVGRHDTGSVLSGSGGKSLIDEAQDREREFLSALEEGRDLFNRGCFFEAHDVWEDLWAGTRGPERQFLEGLIHAAVGCYHLNTGNFRGARSQLALCREALQAWQPTHRGIDVGAVLAMVGEYRDRLPEKGRPRLDNIEQPRIRRAP